MGISLLKGQYFHDGEVKWLPEVIVNDTLARRFWPGEDAIGKQIKISGIGRLSQSATIIGVIADIKHNVLDVVTKPEIYMSSLNPFTPAYHLGAMFLVVHTTKDAPPLTSAIRNEAGRLDKNQPVFNIMTMEDRIARSIFTRRFSMWLLSSAAVVALLLSFVGTFGVMSYVVAQQTPEITIRLALGARPADLLKLVIKQVLRIALAGIIIGMGGAFLVVRLTAKMLFGVNSSDPVVFTLTPMLLLSFVLLACYVPVRKALKVDPLVVLRTE